MPATDASAAPPSIPPGAHVACLRPRAGQRAAPRATARAFAPRAPATRGRRRFAVVWSLSMKANPLATT
eukprot:1407607-Alexandrium_andersonii.AAC.1